MIGSSIYFLYALLTFTSAATATAQPLAPAEFEASHSPLERGLALSYADSLAGRPLASGEKYDPQALTMAHRLYPFRTKLLVVNPQNQDTVEVTVNDRIADARSVDYMVSRATLTSLGMQTSAKTELHIVGATFVSASEEKTSTDKKTVTAYSSTKAGGRVFQSGIASFYGNEFNGRKTASGQRFNNSAYTAAHRSLPFGSLVKVVNPRNGRSVVVRINDRGPFVRGRVVDLSKAAARKIGISGIGKVQLVLLNKNEVEIEAVELESPKKLPSTAPQEDQNGAYTVQVYTLFSADHAERAKDLLEGSWVEADEKGASSVFRVYFKRYKTEKDAIRAAEWLLARGFSGFVKSLN